MRIEEIIVKNFRGLKDVKISNIPGFAVIVGANGAGKSTLIGVFDFLKDCLKDNVRQALKKRGGFNETISRGYTEDDIIVIELAVKLDLTTEEGGKSRIVRYRIEIGLEDRNRPIVRKEILQYRRFGTGAPYQFIKFENGSGEAIPETLENFDQTISDEDITEREHFSLDSPDILALKGLGQFKRFDAASQLRELIEDWTISDFKIDEARMSRESELADHLNSSGNNIALYAQYLNDEFPEVFANIVEKMSNRVPGINSVAAEDTSDGRVALKFGDENFADHFIARAVSDGTIKMFAYLALLYDPEPHPLLCVEEPENQLYPTLLESLAEEFAQYSERRKSSGQVFVTTHSPDFLNAVPIDSIYWLEKIRGFTEIRKASDKPQLVDLVNAGDQPGELWRQGLFGAANP